MALKETKHFYSWLDFFRFILDPISTSIKKTTQYFLQV